MQSRCKMSCRRVSAFPEGAGSLKKTVGQWDTWDKIIISSSVPGRLGYQKH
jgi:hypothetical protein